MLKIQEYVDIKDYSTMKIGGQFRYFTELENKDELENACNFREEKNISIFILGGGSNVIFSDGVINVLAIKMEIKGFEIINETNEYVDIQVGAGENWDELVKKTIDMDVSGLESLSLIPGTVGASPVQNIGAYGAEVKDSILEVEAYDTKENKFVNISNKDCKFGYRDSIFKNEAKGRYVIIRVTYRLEKIASLVLFEKNFSKALSYPGIKRYFLENNINNPTLNQIREAVIDIRMSKLPNPKTLPNTGSFFKNPIVDNVVASKIKKQFPDAKFFPVDSSLTKIPAGWLIENAGLKGKSFGNISIYNKNALVLVNNGNATKEDLLKAKDEIVRIVEQKFGITLEQEPEMI